MAQRLSIKHLQVLAAFRRTGSLSKIAELLKLTPSAVSRRIDEAEARLGAALFTKVATRVRLTPAGEHILQAAERILADLDRAESVASQLTINVHHVIRIGMAVYSNFAWLPQFAAHLKRVEPTVQLELTAGTDVGDPAALKNHVVDIVVTPLIDEVPGTSRMALFSDELVALVAPSHPLARRQYVRPQDIETEDFYTYSLAVQPGFEYLEFLQPTRAQPRRYVIVDAPESAAAAARGGQGLTVLSKWAVQADLDDGRLVGLSLSERGVRIAWAALLRTSDGTDSVVAAVAGHLQDFLAGERRPRAGATAANRSRAGVAKKSIKA